MCVSPCHKVIVLRPHSPKSLRTLTSSPDPPIMNIIHVIKRMYVNELREGPSGCTPGDGFGPSITDRRLKRSSHLLVPHGLSLLLLADSRQRDYGEEAVLI